MAGLGRIVAPDGRDHAYLAARRLPAQVPLADRLWYCRWVLDQGETGTCVGHGMKGLLLSAPVAQGKPDVAPSAFQVYDEATQLDEWPDNDHDVNREWGTSVRAGFKALVARKLMAEYNWAFDGEIARAWLMLHGPVVLGTTWYSSMFDVRADGFLTVDEASGVAGGHCYLAVGYSVRRNAIRVLNSWGRDWGQHGRAWLAYADFDKLIREDGEAGMGLDLRLARQTEA